MGIPSKGSLGLIAWGSFCWRDYVTKEIVGNRVDDQISESAQGQKTKSRLQDGVKEPDLLPKAISPGLSSGL